MPAQTDTTLPEMTLADIVTADPRAAAILDRAGLDYCCQGHQTLKDAARARGLPVAAVSEPIAALPPRDGEENAAEATDLSAITRHIVQRHHAYVREMTPIIEGWLAKLVARHGARHPELADVEQTFAALAADLSTHMTKEETLLFPFIDELAAASRAGRPLPPGPFGTVLNPIRVMEEDHREAGDLLARLRSLTDDFQVPAGGCQTYRLCFAELARFDSDLRRHVHLENHVLFPRATALEHALS